MLHTFKVSHQLALPLIVLLLFSFILVSLDNIQVHLENPFDQIGEDDVHFDVETFAEKLS